MPVVYDKDGCPRCPEEKDCPPKCAKPPCTPPCTKPDCPKDFKCEPPNTIKKNQKDDQNCDICDICTKPPPPHDDCKDQYGPKHVCKLDQQIVELYNKKFGITRRLNIAMKRMAWNRCMNHRQLQKVTKLKLNPKDPNDAEI